MVYGQENGAINKMKIKTLTVLFFGIFLGILIHTVTADGNLWDGIHIQTDIRNTNLATSTYAGTSYIDAWYRFPPELCETPSVGACGTLFDKQCPIYANITVNTCNGTNPFLSQYLLNGNVSDSETGYRFFGTMVNSTLLEEPKNRIMIMNQATSPQSLMCYNDSYCILSHNASVGTSLYACLHSEYYNNSIGTANERDLLFSVVLGQLGDYENVSIFEEVQSNDKMTVNTAGGQVMYYTIEDDYAESLDCGIVSTTTTTTLTDSCSKLIYAYDIDNELTEGVNITLKGWEGQEYNLLTDSDGLATFNNLDCVNYDITAFKFPLYSNYEYYTGIWCGGETLNLYLEAGYQTPTAYNVTVWVEQYLNINMELNEIELFECSDPNTCKYSSIYQGTELCNLLTSDTTPETTNDTGYYNKNNIDFLEPYACMHSQLWTSIGGFKDKYDDYALASSTSTDIIFNVSYGVSDGANYELCFQFRDYVTDELLITDIIFTVLDGVYTVVEETTIDSNPVCFNATELEREYLVDSYLADYTQINDYFVWESEATKTVYMQPHTIADTNLFDISGYVFNSDEDLLKNEKLVYSCGDGKNGYKYSDTNAFYNLSNMTENIQCTIKNDNPTYTIKTYYFTLNADKHDFNLTFTLSPVSSALTSQPIRAIDKNYGTYLEGVNIRASTSGKDSVYCPTDNTGRCTLKGLEYINWVYTATFNTYEPYQISQYPDSVNELKMYMEETTPSNCYVQGTTYSQNNTIKKTVVSDIYVYDRNTDSLLIHKATSALGEYKIFQLCGKQIKIIGEYTETGTSVLKETKYVTLPLTADSGIQQDFVFISEDMTKQEKQEDIINWIWSFTDLFKWIILLIFIAMLFKAIDSIKVH